MAGTRPATARMRESIFNRPDVQACVVDGAILDLYAGTGLLGIEALSRGAARVDFVERAQAACALIQRNLTALGLAARARVICRDVARVRPGPTPGTAGRPGAAISPPYDLCFADPPYAVDASTVLAALAAGTLLAPGGLLLWRSGPGRPAGERLGLLVRTEVRRYGDGMLATFTTPDQGEE